MKCTVFVCKTVIDDHLKISSTVKKEAFNAMLDSFSQKKERYTSGRKCRRR